MNSQDLVHHRLAAQQLTHHPSTNPGELVAALGAVQAQDYPAARWALGLRLPGLTDVAIADAINRGEVIRTHVMRPTWHFVSPADIRWLLALTAPRVHKVAASNY